MRFSQIVPRMSQSSNCIEETISMNVTAIKRYG